MRQSGFANRSDATDLGVAVDSVQSDVILQSTFQDTLLLRLLRLRLAWRASGVRHTRIAEKMRLRLSQRWPICDKILTVSLKLMRRIASPVLMAF